MEAIQGSLFSMQTLTTNSKTAQPTKMSPPKKTERQGAGSPWEAALAMPSPNLRLGLCSFTDPDWRGSFYHDGEQDLLAAYATLLPSVEVDTTFYGVPKISVVESWASRVPENFKFCLKFPREITHDKMLEKTEYVTKVFLDVASRLGNRLGPLLLQFPYSFRATHFPHLSSFLESLPKDFRYVVEIRHRSWLRQPFFQLLEDQKVALCWLDHPLLPKLEKKTTDFVYARWLGDRRDATGPFSRLRRDPSLGLKWWVKRMKPLTESDQAVYGFANNYYAGHAPSTLQKIVEVWSK
jgi:uncharacterized protein YecE (DUF72 family)